MSSNSETGHARNVSNFGTLTASVVGLGLKYNPVNPLITVSALNQLHTDASGAMSGVNSKLTIYSNTASAREAVFSGLSKRITRVMGALRSSGASAAVIDGADSFAKLIRGMRINPKKSPETAGETGENSSASKSTSRMSYSSRLDNFDKFIKYLEASNVYATNEEDISLDSLKAYYTALLAVNSPADEAETNLDNARIARDKILYAPGTGLVAIALIVKEYVKSVFGASAPEYKNIKSIKFTAP